MIRLLCVAGCDSEQEACADDLRTITEGVYGAARYIAIDRVADDQPLKGVDIVITGGGGIERHDVRTDDDGFYELSLASGYYSMESDFAMVGDQFLTLGVEDYPDLQRVDLVVDEGLFAGWQYGSPESCR